MRHDKFNELVKKTIERCSGLLLYKSKEYSTSADALHNFKVAAAMQGITAKQALCGMMAKHTVSIYDMCANTSMQHSNATWDEKIGDSINYLLLLRALVEEEVNV